jgi:TPR repeat protein
VARAMAMPGDARELALDEAWFFIGEQAMAAGDRRAARVEFERVHPHAVIGTIVYGRAMAALAALESEDPDYRSGMALSWKGDQNGAVQAWTRAAQRGVAEARYRLGLAYHYGEGVQEDRTAAAHWFELAAKQDHPGAANMVGHYLMNGYGGLGRDSAAATEWFRRGAELGDDVAALNLGRNYSNGDGNARDRALGTRYLLQAAELNDITAQELLVWRFAEGDGVVQDDSAAALWAQRAAARGSLDAAVDLGRFLWTGRGVEKKPELGTRMIRKAAESGGKAVYFMGEAYLFGHGVDKDPATAFQWFDKAARGGHSFAKLQVGLAYMNGAGVARNQDRGIRWLELASADGLTKADMVLAYAYVNGDGRPADPARAAVYFTKAAQNGNHEAEWRLGGILRDGKGVPADPVQAAAWMRKAAGAVSQAATELARMYQAGIGVDRDLEQAKSYFHNAARAGDCEAMDGLARMYENGEGAKPDLRLAQVFYTLAARDASPTLCVGDAARAQQLAGRLDAAQLASARASVEAWKSPQPLPDEREESAVTVR